MKSYIQKPSNINKSQFEKHNFSLSSQDYHKLLCLNTNCKPLTDFIIEEKQGREIGSENYCDIKKYRFLKTANITDNYLIDYTSEEYCIPIHNIKPKENDILIAKDGNGAGLGESCLCNGKSQDDIISSGILCLTLKPESLYYNYAFIKSQLFKNFIDINTAEGSTIRHSKKIALEFQIPFPKNEDTIKQVSEITQNIIDKELNIRLKNEKIDKMIEEELMNNQGDKVFKYTCPTINEIKAENRFDTGLYSEEYKKTKFLIENYKGGGGGGGLVLIFIMVVIFYLKKMIYKEGIHLNKEFLGKVIYG
ncbi:MAG: hypothetical protein LBH46_00510 [Rickettsiales bacterium]|jgi:hypothetical protein|nr:hypothetical protein [Rickettsiales bacterium]